MSPGQSSVARDAAFEPAYAHYTAERWEAAASALRDALQRFPDQALGWFRLGNAHEELGRDRDALACFERCVALEPGNAPALNNLGAACQRLDDPDRARECYEAALRHDPGLAQPYLNLGRLAENRGDLAAAAGHYRAALAQHPGNPQFEHLLAAVSGRRTPRAPSGYVSALFDAAAAQFDRHLVGDLGYRIPQQLAELVRTALTAQTRTPRVLDLGCGTGLVGVAFGADGPVLTGIDLSGRMLARAAQTGRYAQLLKGDLLEVLAGLPARSFDAALSADVFIYLGELDAVFAEVARLLAPGGLFAFSVERAGADEAGAAGYQLRSTGRYAQSVEYLRACAARSAFTWLSDAAVPIRREKDGFAEGQIVLLARAA